MDQFYSPNNHQLQMMFKMARLVKFKLSAATESLKLLVRVPLEKLRKVFIYLLIKKLLLKFLKKIRSLKSMILKE